jgi:hypothetical protein
MTGPEKKMVKQSKAKETKEGRKKKMGKPITRAEPIHVRSLRH